MKSDLNAEVISMDKWRLCQLDAELHNKLYPNQPLSPRDFLDGYTEELVEQTAAYVFKNPRPKAKVVRNRSV